LLYFACVLGVRVQDLFPRIPAEEPLRGVVMTLLGTEWAHSKNAMMDAAAPASIGHENQ